MGNNIEIERKFLVKGEFKHLATEKKNIAQGYLSSHPERTVRVRIANDKAFLTIKGKGDESGMKRFEFEKEISLVEAKQLLQICEPGVISKIRYLIKHNNHLIEVDVFEQENKGLVLAEIELNTIDEDVKIPDWLGKEVTGDKRYYNSYISKHPFTSW